MTHQHPNAQKNIFGLCECCHFISWQKHAAAYVWLEFAADQGTLTQVSRRHGFKNLL